MAEGCDGGVCALQVGKQRDPVENCRDGQGKGGMRGSGESVVREREVRSSKLYDGGETAAPRPGNKRHRPCTLAGLSGEWARPH
jgi:hypothetical protein